MDSTSGTEQRDESYGATGKKEEGRCSALWLGCLRERQQL